MKYKIILYNKPYGFTDGTIIQYDQDQIIRQFYFRFNPKYFFRISMNTNPHIKISNYESFNTTIDCLKWLKDQFNEFYTIAYNNAYNTNF